MDSTSSEYYGGTYQYRSAIELSSKTTEPNRDEDEVPLLEHARGTRQHESKSHSLLSRNVFAVAGSVVVVILLFGFLAVRSTRPLNTREDPLSLQSSSSHRQKHIYPCQKECKNPCGSYVEEGSSHPLCCEWSKGPVDTYTCSQTIDQYGECLCTADYLDYQFIIEHQNKLRKEAKENARKAAEAKKKEEKEAAKKKAEEDKKAKEREKFMKKEAEREKERQRDEERREEERKAIEKKREEEKQKYIDDQHRRDKERDVREAAHTIPPTLPPSISQKEKEEEKERERQLALKREQEEAAAAERERQEQEALIRKQAEEEKKRLEEEKRVAAEKQREVEAAQERERQEKEAKKQREADEKAREEKRVADEEAAKKDAENRAREEEERKQQELIAAQEKARQEEELAAKKREAEAEEAAHSPDPTVSPSTGTDFSIERSNEDNSSDVNGDGDGPGGTYRSTGRHR